MLYPVQITRPDGSTFTAEVEADTLAEAKEAMSDIYGDEEGYAVWFPPSIILPPAPDSGVRVRSQS